MGARTGPYQDPAEAVMATKRTAHFDANDHATHEGWATYHTRPPSTLRCRWRGHVMPSAPSNRHSPACYDRCTRCRAWLKWFVIGQHRYGSVDRDVWMAYEAHAVASRAGIARRYDGGNT